MRKSEITIVVLVVLAFIIGLVIYPQMPAEMVSHWNAQGQADDTMPRFWGVFMMPLVVLVMAGMFLLIPRIDPLKENIAQFLRYYDGFVILMTIFMVAIYGLTLLWNMDIKINPAIVVMGGVAIIFYYAGVLMSHAKRNWFIGIRTPWTLSNDVVWEKTHKIGAWMFKVMAGVMLLTIFMPPEWMFVTLMTLAIGSTLFLLVYSYVEYQRQIKQTG